MEILCEFKIDVNIKNDALITSNEEEKKNINTIRSFGKSVWHFPF